MVWSRAPRKSASRTAPRISSLARWLRPRAGSSASDGVRPSASAGNDSMSAQSLPCCVGEVGTSHGRRRSWSESWRRDGDAASTRRRRRRPREAPTMACADAAQLRRRSSRSRTERRGSRRSARRPRSSIAGRRRRDPDEDDPPVVRERGRARRSRAPPSGRSGRSRSRARRSSTSASWLIVISPCRWSVYMMWSWAMLTPRRRSRSLEAHLSWLIVARKSAMMAPVEVARRSAGSAGAAVGRR